MKAEEVSRALSGLALGPLRSFERIDSTNDEARRWAEEGAPDRALVIADEQTAGKGRQGRKWFTPPEAALAFSLVLRGGSPRPLGLERGSSQLESWMMRLTALGSVSVCQALREQYQLTAQIKWPNDVLLERRKVAGVLVEALWQGEQLQAAILGIGINVAPESTPPEAELIYPATCVETALGRPVGRLELLRAVVTRSLYWLERLASADFLRAWDESLAFKGEWVNIVEGELVAPALRQGKLLGLDEMGRLRLRDRSGEEFSLLTGELRLRPAAG